MLKCWVIFPTEADSRPVMWLQAGNTVTGPASFVLRQLYYTSMYPLGVIYRLGTSATPGAWSRQPQSLWWHSAIGVPGQTATPPGAGRRFNLRPGLRH
jgi:hypothetical protein